MIPVTSMTVQNLKMLFTQGQPLASPQARATLSN